MEAQLEARRLDAKRGLIALAVVGIALVATHKGEFWPYSVYPTFSQGGRAWTRSIVREDAGISESERWLPRTLGTLPGKPFALSPHDIPQIDFSEYIDHTKTWDKDRVEGLRAMFGNYLSDRTLLIFRVNSGHEIVEDAAATPLLRLSPHDSEVNPAVQEASR